MDRPHVVVNMAMTADGKVDTAARQGARISSDTDVRRVDELRASADAVMVGGHTLLGEDPRLTVRSEDLVAARRAIGKPSQPARVGVVSELRDGTPGVGLPAGGRFMRGEAARVVLFTTERTPVAERAAFTAAGAEVIVLGNRHVDLVAALRHLADTGVRRLVVEGGGTLVEALLRDRLVDEITLYVAPLILGGVDAPTPAEGPGFSIDDAIRLRLVDTSTLGDGGLVLRYRVAPGGGAAADASNAPNEEG